MIIERTIVELDMVAYSTIATVLEQSLGPSATLELNEVVRRFAEISLAGFDAAEDARLLVTTGDGAILSFKTPTAAHTFLERFYALARTQNEGKSEPTAMRVFRSGVAYGKVLMEMEGQQISKFAGTTISIAVRLESAAKLGGVLIDEESYRRLPESIQARYEGPEQVPGKRAEVFSAFRYLFDPSAAEKIASLTIRPEDRTDRPLAHPLSAVHFDSSAPSARLDVLDQMELLCGVPGLLAKLATAIGIPAAERPSSTLTCIEQCPAIFDWAEFRKKLNHLFQSVQRLILKHGLGSQP